MSYKVIKNYFTRRLAAFNLYEAKKTGRNRIVLVPEFGLDGKPLS